jgi:predicted dehydrogenase
VRWTENRNMQAFQALLHQRSIDVGYLTSHRFNLDEAPAAYDLIVNGEEKVLGAIIAYDTDGEPGPAGVQLRTPPRVSGRETLAVSFIGAGSYAMSHLLPNVANQSGVTFSGVMTSSGTSSRTVADKFGFAFATPEIDEILDPERTNTVFIATRHNTHAGYVMAALRNNISVFVEKPLCMVPEELTEIDALYTGLAGTADVPALMVGFNRRFAPLARQMQDALGTGPMAMTYRVNAGHIPGDSWIQDPQLGGGRIVGEVCHFVDYLTWLNGSLPVSVYASVVRTGAGTDDTLNVVINFANGSSGTIGYYATGSKALAKEYVEAHRAGVSVVLDDFRALRVYSGGRKSEKKAMSQNKGQPQMVAAFVAAACGKSGPAIEYPELLAVTRATFAIVESLRSGQPVTL